MSKFGELVLLAGDSCLPFEAIDLPEFFKKMLIPGKFKHVLLTGNLCTERELNFFRTLCNDVVCVRGCFDEMSSTTNVVERTVCGFKIVAVSGDDMMVNATDLLLTTTAERLNCDILVYGGTHKMSVEKKGKTVFVNPGSLTGAFSSSNPSNDPSFLLLALKPDEITVFSYQMKDGKLDVGKTCFKRDE
ncbi:hypothetical protein WA538_004329 [Blastocystis sp. DL]